MKLKSKLKFRHFVLVVSTIYAMTPLTSYADTKRSPQYQKCMDNVDLGALKNSQFAACGEQELKQQDVTLNASYNKLRAGLSPEQREALIKGQRAWLTYRENWCRFEEVGPSAPGGYANYTSCLLFVTDLQIKSIKAYSF